MKRIDFYKKKMVLHIEMLEAIQELFEKVGFDEITFGENDRQCWVIISENGCDSTQEVQVRKVHCIDGEVGVLLEGRDRWISCQHAGKVVTDCLDDLYDAVYDVISDITHVYYACELNEKGIPTGKVVKEIMRLEDAEKMVEQRIRMFGKDFVYRDFNTALLHAQYKS